MQALEVIAGLHRIGGVTVLRELLNANGGVITLNAIWVSISTDGTHIHKECGQYNSVVCVHEGVAAHSVGTTEYREWKNSSTTDPSGSGYYYLSDTISRSNKVINVSGKLVICLNGKDLTGVRFQGSGGNGEVIITNCASYKATITSVNSNLLFTGVKGRVYGKVETIVKADRIIAGNNQIQ